MNDKELFLQITMREFEQFCDELQNDRATQSSFEALRELYEERGKALLFACFAFGFAAGFDQ